MTTLCRYSLLLVIAMLGMVSRVAAQSWVEKLHVEGVAKVSHLSSSGMNLWVTLNNESCHGYEIKSCEIDIYVEQRYVATISLRDRVVIPRRATTDVLLPLRFKSPNSFVLERLLWRMIEDRGEEITISYRMRAGTRLIKRNFRAEGLSLSDILGRNPSTIDIIEAVWDLVG